jgi:hypothetical protein
MLKSFLCSVLLLITLRAVAAPQQTLGEAVSKLTGPHHREWDYGGAVSYQTGGGCTGGQTWIFYSNQALTKKICKDGRLHEQNLGWAPSVRSSGAFAITIGSETYEMRFPYTKAKQLKMTLTLTEGNKSDGLEELDFLYTPGSK